jgi:predicted MFS family arabinose efflux permease
MTAPAARPPILNRALLGAPALALPASSTMAAILAVSLVRGLGFAICVVVGGALVAALVPPERRGEGLGLFGIVVGVPGGVLAGLRAPALHRPALAFSATAMASGVVVTFLPLALPRGSGGLAAMTLMLSRVAPSTYGTVSAIWKLAYDAGIGVGAFGFGVVAARTGYPPAFAVTAALMLAALVLRPARPARPATIWPS